MAVEILFDTIKEYAYPLLSACGLNIDPYGYVVDKNNRKLCMTNPKYTEGDNTSEISPVTYPVIPLKDSDYLEIKEKPDIELFNPFTNIKHASVIAIKMKQLAVIDLNPDLLKTAIDEDDWNDFDKYVGLSNDTNSMGQIDYALVDLSLPNKPEILRYTCPPDDPIKGLWALCVEMYNTYISQKPPYLKQFQDIDKSWKKIKSAMKKWDKLRKEIVSEVRKENNQNMNIEYMDFSDSISPGSAINIFTIPKPLTANDFIDVADGSDINDPGLQNFLTSLFNKESLKPYEPEPKFENPAPIPIEETKPETIQVVDNSKNKQNSIFKKSTKTLNFNYPSMHGNVFNPMFGNSGINPKYNMTMNLDDLCLGDVFDPFANYA